ncbi:DUF4190 domain-containing protein [Actinomyces slackii]|uniref:DUF4190 domain-containing protein n=1 Tax=Actinomyces slackii TaxID=52774 RepID=A0A448KE16_9ACTO|nr:DUF4190 domain-containing protein [Actinomyces slackii]VEG75120.1 Uncharacterised protein [Actinomyces slackii]
MTSSDRVDDSDRPYAASAAYGEGPAPAQQADPSPWSGAPGGQPSGGPAPYPAQSYPGGYAYPPPGAYPPGYRRPDEMNWAGIVSLILALCGVQPVGLIFGIIAMMAVRDGKADNKGIAMAGLIISAVTLALAVIVFVAYIAFVGAVVYNISETADYSSTMLSL